MKIRELSINNCLSFGDKGLNESNSIELGDFNLLIGSNNSGKSNVLKIMEILSLIIRSVRDNGAASLQDFPLSLKSEPNDFKDWVFAQELSREMEFSFTLEIEKTDQTIAKILDNYEPRTDSKNPVLFMFNHKQGYPKTIKANGFIKYEGDVPVATITKVEIPNDHLVYGKEPILFDRKSKKILALTPEVPGGRLVWRILQRYPAAEVEWKSDFSQTNRAFHSFMTQIHDSVFEKLFVNIRAIRAINPVGDEVAETLSRFRYGRQKERKVFSRVQAFINELIFRDVGQGIELSFPGDSGAKRIEIVVGDLILPLSHYGSAVEQILALAAEIVRHGSNKVVLIEEPEAHFYPDLQRKFIRFLKENQETFKHQYLIATHSSAFIDEFINMTGNVFHVQCEQGDETEPKYSQVEPLNKDKLPILFKTLGIRPSDLLLANGILVVEGITDKEVYTDWARKIEKPFEGISLEVLDIEGAGNIKKYLLSNAIQRTCFQRYALYDKNAKELVRKAVEGIVPDENIIPLKKGDIEDYYPRELVLEFAREFAPKKGKMPEEIPGEIKEGETVKKLNKLLNGDWWKRNLAEKIIKEMKPEQIDEEIRTILTKIYDSIY